METKLVRILQIGDVHFPDGEKTAFSADKKDTAISDAFTDAFASNTFQDSTRKMLSVFGRRLSTISAEKIACYYGRGVCDY